MTKHHPAPVLLRDVRLPVPGLERPLRLVHLTDLHFGVVTPLSRQIAAVALANACAPDLVILTGDYVGRGLRHVHRVAEVLSALEAPRLAVLGNHDHWAGAATVRAALEDSGARVLVNEHVSFAGLTVVGLDDPYTGHDDLDLATQAVPPGPRIALAHDPAAAPALWAKGVPLVFSGHTHGGQVDVGKPIDWFFKGFVAGTYAAPDGAGQLYVSAGIGCSGMPVRWGRRSRAEVTRVELVPAQQAPAA
jgi:predicted MPP superfamily phosphohydrolase